jgi:repressor LexA
MERTRTPQPASRFGRKTPYFGYTAAGTPKDIIPFSNQFIRFPIKNIRSDMFSLTVRGTSMTEAGINDGDSILLQAAETPENGAIMLIRHEDQSTVKRVRIKGNRVFLCWEDGSHNQIEVDSIDYEIQGKLVNVLRTPRR